MTSFEGRNEKNEAKNRRQLKRTTEVLLQKRHVVEFISILLNSLNNLKKIIKKEKRN